MNFFKRLFKMGQAEANSTLDNMEDPIKLTEQGIRDMKVDLEKSLEALAQVKALAIRSKNEYEEFLSKVENYQEKAMLLLTKAKKGTLKMSEAERLAKESLIKKEESSVHAENSKAESAKLEGSVSQLEKNVVAVRKNISKWENELKTLKARVKVSNATQKLNKQMADIDASSTVSMLERMKEKVHQEEALAEAYGDIANANKSIDDEIDKAIDFTADSAENELTKLKEQLGFSNDIKS
ncbi:MULTISPECIES: PspA/IM30 family protein [unclassified Polaribacter]|uniref:PspA/IM30 family protein n=1 Tax=unclassified Polaribacter TaxID=196858 RepID=UPI0011BEBFEA|nr:MULTISPECIES: PspA/IM30 family protein [unclassified Polaribacter]TXD53185.1 PspA/IM30 family protein [Polaribacter sp. IC063]TXD61333.1 PspA/IM30 family protein [Polaribacter sp. IC066]